MVTKKSPVRCVVRVIARFSIGIGVTLGLLSTQAAAQPTEDRVWTGAGGDARWSNPANWTGGYIPTTGSLLHFPAGATPLAVNDIPDLQLKGIQIEGLPNVSSYIITGLGVTMLDRGWVNSDTAQDAQGRGPTIALPIAIAPLPGFYSQLFIGVWGAPLAVTGAITGNESSQLRKVGTGDVNLGSPANAWSSLFVAGGTVRLTAAGALPANSTVDLELVSRLDLNTFNATISYLTSTTSPTLIPTISLGNGTATLAIASGNFHGRIDGVGEVVKTGTDQLFFGGTAAHSYFGTTTMNGGTLVLAKAENATSISTALVINSGTVRVSSPEQIWDNASVTINSPGVLELGMSGAGMLQETIGSIEGSGDVRLDEGWLRVGANNRSTTFAGTIGGRFESTTHLSLEKIGTGTLTLTGVHTYEGITSLREGTLLVNGSIGTGLGTQMRVYGGTLGGTGTIAHDLYAANTGTRIAPGTSPGILHAPRVEMQDCTYVVEINGPTAGGDYDQIDITHRRIRFSGGSTLEVSLAYNPPGGTQFTIVKSPAGPTHAPSGTLAGLPEGAELLLRNQRFGISYRGGAGNDIVLTALEDPPSVSIDDVTVIEGSTGTTEAVFTVALSRTVIETVGVQYTIANGTAAAPADYTAQSGTLMFLPGTTTQTVTVSVTGDRDVEPDETFVVRLSGLSGVSVSQGIVRMGKAQGAGTIVSDDAARIYFLAEGATGSFFDEDILIANPNATIAPITLTFLTQNGEQVVAQRSIPAWSHVTVHADLIPGLESAAASVTVTSETGVPLMVERTMFWDATYYAGHTGSSVDQPSRDWLFAEGSQGFFNTFVLVANPHDTATDVTFTFLIEAGDPVVVTRTIPPTARLTLSSGEIPELADRSFGVAVHAKQPITAERSMYFGTTPARPWSGGAESAGVTSASTHWFLAEGATGDFFDTFILLSNPQSEPANVTVRYLLHSGETVTETKEVPANGRVTINIEGENDPRLRSAAVSTVVTSDRPIIAERSMYWAGAPWREAHNSFGVPELGTRWALAEGRVGGALSFHTYVLLANPQTDAAHVTVTYLREEGAPIVRQYIVPPTSRFNIDVNAIVPEMHDESFGTLIEVTNGVPIAAERSMYWNAQGVFWSGGTNATGMRMP
jgi:autotransporter-associated beta strand protein